MQDPDSELRSFLTIFNSNSNSESSQNRIVTAVIGAGSESGFGIKVLFGHPLITIPIPNPTKTELQQLYSKQKRFPFLQNDTVSDE